MAAHEIPGFKLTGIAGSTAASLTQYTFVAAATGASQPVYNTASTGASGVHPKYIGVVQNAPASGQAAELMVSGVSKVVAGEAIVAGQYVTIGASGKAAVAASGAMAAGIAESTTTAADQLVSVNLLHGVQA